MTDLALDISYPPNREAFYLSLNTSHQQIFESNLTGYRLFECELPLEQLESQLRKYAPALLIVDCDELSNDVVALVRHIDAVFSLPILVFAQTDAQENVRGAMRAGAVTCVVDGLAPHRLPVLLAIAEERFQLQSELKAELHKTRAQIEARKIIERAKGVLMQQKGLSESDAYKMLRRSAMSQSRTIKEIAESVLLVEGLTV